MSAPGTLKLRRVEGILTLEWIADSLDSWFGPVVFCLIFLLVAKVQGGFMWVISSLVCAVVFVLPGPKIWIRSRKTTFDLSSRQVCRLTRFILGSQSERYSFDDVAGLGTVKKEDNESFNSNYCEMVMTLRNGTSVTLGFADLTRERSMILDADEIKETTGL